MEAPAPAPAPAFGEAAATPEPPTALTPTPRPPRAGVAALSLRHRLAAAVVVAVVAVVACVHLGMVFLHVAPPNTLTKQHGEAIDGWIYPEFEQNWKLFAPDPLQQNIAVEARAEIRTADGTGRTTVWYGLSAADGKAVDRNPVPSHTQQNELRRAWDVFVSSHGNDNRPAGLRGQLTEQYLRRIVTMRLVRTGIAGPGETVARVQVRSRTTDVPAPEWSQERTADRPVFRTLPWWQVPADEVTGATGRYASVGMTGGDAR